MPPKPPTIEELFALIEEAVAALEAGELPLEESLTRFESGLKAMKQARGLLDRYAARLEELRAQEDGAPGTSAASDSAS